MVLVASPGYLRARGRTPVREPRDLARHRILGTHLEETTWKLVRDDGRRAAVRVTPHFAADETTALLAAAKAGLGIASLPARACDSELREKTLVRVAREWRAGDVTTTLLLADRRVLLPAVRAVAVAIVAAGEADAEANGT